jgi:hypothetical protein
MPPPIEPQQALAPDAVQVPREISAVASFFSVEGVGAALAATNFTRKEHTEHLITIARTAEKDGDRLKALQMVHKISLDVLTVNGHLTKVSESHADPNGSVRTAEARTLHRLLAGAGQPFSPHTSPGLEGITALPPSPGAGHGDGPGQRDAHEVPPPIDGTVSPP